jgi:hypothetical protein
MTRNPKEASKRKRDGYSWESPPENVAAAHSKMEILEHEMSKINSDLEHRKPEDFPSGEEHEGWQKRARGALGWMEREHNFLERWLRYVDKRRQEERTEEEERRITNARAQAEVALKARLEQLVSDIRERYTRVYGTSHPPKDRPTAEERDVLVSALHERIVQEFAEVNALAADAELTKKQAKRLLFPLHRIGQRVRTEKDFLRHFLRSFSVPAEPMSGLTATVIKLTEQAHELVDRLEREWLFPETSEDYLESGMKAVARRKVLVARRRQILEAQSDFKRLCQEQALEPDLERGVMMPLLDLQKLVDEEAANIRAYLGAPQAEDRERLLEELEEIAQGVCERAESLARSLEEECTPLYNDGSPPPGREEAKLRLAQIPVMRTKVQSALSEVKSACASHSLRRSDLAQARLPLSRLLDMIQTETAFLKAFLAENSAEKPFKASGRWKSVCLGALTRAVLDGFKLTPDEQEVLKEMLADMTASSVADSN